MAHAHGLKIQVIRTASWLACGLWAVSPLLAQGPLSPPAPLPPVEIWEGIKRVDIPVDPGKKANPATVPTSENPADHSEEAVGKPVLATLEPEAPRKAELPAEPKSDSPPLALHQMEPPPLPPFLDSKPAACTITTVSSHTLAETCVAQPGDLGKPTVASAGEHSPQAPSGVVGPIHEDPAGLGGAHPDLSSNSFFFKMALVQMVSILAGLVLGPLVLLAALAYVLRRNGSYTGSLFRVELVNASIHGLAATSGEPSLGKPGLPPVAAPAEGSSAQPFDLGPSYEEERRAKEEALLKQEEAVLRHVFDENLRLQEQIETEAEAD
jgi:hypothetical protein